MEDATDSGLIQATRDLFVQATDAATLRNLARGIKEIRHREEECLQLGAKALIQALAYSDDGEFAELERELAEVQASCARLEREVDQLNREEDAKQREQDLRDEVEALEAREDDKRKEFERAGGEAQLRRQEAKPRSGRGLDKLQQVKRLYQHITRIRWNLDVPEEETAGEVVDNKENVIKQFRVSAIRTPAGEPDYYTIANKVWQTLG